MYSIYDELDRIDDSKSLLESKKMSKKKKLTESAHSTIKDKIEEIVKAEFETGHALADDYETFQAVMRDEGLRATTRAYEYYQELRDLGPAGFYEEFKDKFDFDPMFVQEYGSEDYDDDIDEEDYVDSVGGFKLYDNVVTETGHKGFIINFLYTDQEDPVAEIKRGWMDSSPIRSYVSKLRHDQEKLTENRNNHYFAPYGYRDAAKVLNRKAPEYYYHRDEIEMAEGDGIKLARYAMKKGLPVMIYKYSDPDYPEFAIKGEYHWNDYFYPYPTAHEEDFVAWDGKMFVEESLVEGSYDPHPAGKYGDLIFEILDSCSGDAVINFMHEYRWPFHESGDSISDVYDKINKYLDTHSGYGLWSDLDKHFN